MHLNLKKHKKVYLISSVAVVAIVVAGALLWKPIQFKYYCKEKEVCACANQKLTDKETETFIKVARYMNKTKKTEVDATVLREVSLDDMTAMGLKMKSCAADAARNIMLNTLDRNRQNFPGDYNCMRQVLINELSNEEVLFLNSVQTKKLDVLKNSELRGLYLESSFKLMKCMPDNLQNEHQKEIKENTPKQAPKKKPNGK